MYEKQVAYTFKRNSSNIQEPLDMIKTWVQIHCSSYCLIGRFDFYVMSVLMCRCPVQYCPTLMMWDDNKKRPCGGKFDTFNINNLLPPPAAFLFCIPVFHVPTWWTPINNNLLCNRVSSLWHPSIFVSASPSTRKHVAFLWCLCTVRYVRSFCVKLKLGSWKHFLCYYLYNYCIIYNLRKYRVVWVNL